MDDAIFRFNKLKTEIDQLIKNQLKIDHFINWEDWLEFNFFPINEQYNNLYSQLSNDQFNDQVEYVDYEENIWEIIANDCDGKMFTRVEELPSFKISKTAFEDTLSLYLKANNAFYTNKKFTFLFVLTTRSQILDLVYLPGNAPEENTLYAAFLNHSRFWVPAKQNGHLVCAYVKCDLEFKDNRLSVRIFQ